MTAPAVAAQRFLVSLALGGSLGLWYGFLRPLGAKHTAVRDGLFVPVLVWAWLVLGFQICAGDWRVGYLAGLFLGCVIFDLTAGLLLRPIFGTFWKLLATFWELFLWPAKKILHFVKILFASAEKYSLCIPPLVLIMNTSSFLPGW